MKKDFIDSIGNQLEWMCQDFQIIYALEINKDVVMTTYSTEQ